MAFSSNALEWSPTRALTALVGNPILKRAAVTTQTICLIAPSLSPQRNTSWCPRSWTKEMTSCEIKLVCPFDFRGTHLMNPVCEQTMTNQRAVSTSATSRPRHGHECNGMPPLLAPPVVSLLSGLEMQQASHQAPRLVWDVRQSMLFLQRGTWGRSRRHWNNLAIQLKLGSFSCFQPATLLSVSEQRFSGSTSFCFLILRYLGMSKLDE